MSIAQREISERKAEQPAFLDFYKNTLQTQYKSYPRNRVQAVEPAKLTEVAKLI